MSETPKKTGWYWTRSRLCGWSMAFVDTASGTIALMDSAAPDFADVEFFQANHGYGDNCEWRGPFECPEKLRDGLVPDSPLPDAPRVTDGSTTVVASEWAHAEAAKDGSAIVVVHADYSHCYGSQSSPKTATAIVTEEKAERLFRDASQPDVQPPSGRLAIDPKTGNSTKVADGDQMPRGYRWF